MEKIIQEKVEDIVFEEEQKLKISLNVNGFKICKNPVVIELTKELTKEEINKILKNKKDINDICLKK